MQLTIRGVPISRAFQMLFRPNQRSLADVRNLFICVADHYEPYWGAPPKQIAHERVARWVEGFPSSVKGIEDSRGQCPQHSFFYPAEDYDPEVIDQLACLVDQGFGDVEVHLHHDNDTSSGFRDLICSFTDALHNRHGLLRRDGDGNIGFAFIHGNWALDNARPDGKWCGVNDEITILRETGCYADLTLPCAPEPGQTRTINSIYYAFDDPQLPKSHDVGRPASVGQGPPEDGLLMIQGPLAWDWRRRKWGLIPKLENGDLHGKNGPTMGRLRQWQRVGATVEGRPDWAFVKLHTHGAYDVNTELFLAGRARQFHEELARYAAQNQRLRYYYVTAHQMAELVHQAEAGHEDPDFQAITPSAVAR